MSLLLLLLLSLLSPGKVPRSNSPVLYVTVCFTIRQKVSVIVTCPGFIPFPFQAASSSDSADSFSSLTPSPFISRSPPATPSSVTVMSPSPMASSVSVNSPFPRASFVSVL